jgi:hypothetical protein
LIQHLFGTFFPTNLHTLILALPDRFHATQTETSNLPIQQFIHNHHPSPSTPILKLHSHHHYSHAAQPQVQEAIVEPEVTPQVTVHSALGLPAVQQAAEPHEVAQALQPDQDVALHSPAHS